MSDALVEAEALRLHPGGPARSFAIGPGLTLVRGGEGIGKTTLLRAIAGEFAPHAGRLSVRATSVRRFDPAEPAADDPRRAHEWLAARRARAPAPDAGVAAALIDAFALGPHLDKTPFMMSMGTRRKLALVDVLASGASLVLLDVPFAALDASSRDALAARLADAAGDTRRGWVLADYERPAALADVPLAGTIDLGD